MSDDSNDLLREAVKLLRGIKTSLDEAEKARAEALASFQSQTDEIMGSVDYDDFDDEPPFEDSPYEDVAYGDGNPFDVDDLEAEFQECQEEARRFEEETRDFREVVTLELRRQSAILERIADALGASRKDKEQG
ncbi:MAG: hypothetical protein ACYTGL_09715 [Planctomycetota bacterium]|jgi:hypothetical protein